MSQGVLRKEGSFLPLDPPTSAERTSEKSSKKQTPEVWKLGQG